MWINRGSGSGQGSWKRVNAVRVDSADGTGAAFKPLRLIDTRNTTGASGQPTLGPATGGTTRNYNVAGINGSVAAQNIPSTAIAVVGNVTVVAGASAGFLAVHPSGVAYSPSSDPATFNFGAHAIVSNAYFCGLGTGASAGKIAVYIGNASSPANFIIDITGYIE